MANVLSPQSKKAIKRTYIMRFISAILFLFSFCLITSLILLVPVYLYVEKKSHTLEKQLNTLSEEKGKESVLNLDDVEKKVNVMLDVNNDSVPMYSIVSDIIGYAPSGIQIAGISIDRSGSTKKKSKEDIEHVIRIMGTANTRSTVVSFRDALQTLTYIEHVDLPVSNLAAQVNIPFQITLMLKQGI